MNIAEHVHEHGYAIVPALLRHEMTERLITEAESIQSTCDATRGGVRNLLAIPSMRALAESASVMNVVHSILGNNVRAVRGILFDKTPDANWKVPWASGCHHRSERTHRH